jgi:hypothetical protein
MRFNTKYPNSGDTRIKMWFAFIPVTIHTINKGIQKETRWLEKVSTVQKYTTELGWSNVRFL